MLSSASYVCLGACSGMWVINRGIYLGVLVLSFISVLLFQFGSFLFAIDRLWCVCVCVCSFCFYFPDVFSSSMWSDLRAAVPQGSSALQQNRAQSRFLYLFYDKESEMHC